MFNIHIKDIKKDQVFYECERGSNIKWVALEDCRIIDDPTRKGYVCRARDEEGDEMELFEAFEVGGYGLRLYSEPQYLSGNSNAEA